MSSYEQAFKGLNEAQKEAVTTTEGPVLVIAGPGTGKTQLLTTRIAHILKTTDTLPQNILCLTFTDSAAHTMRDRLASMIGQDAYDVNVSTYHAFGSDLLRRFPDYFPEVADMRPVDDLGIDAIFREIINDLPYSNPLKFSETYLGDVKSFVSDAKRALLTPDDLRKVAAHNLQFLEQAQPILTRLFKGFTRITKDALDLFSELEVELGAAADTSKPTEKVLPIFLLLLQSLHEANEQATETGKTIPLTAWKNDWLAKDADGQFVIDGTRANQKLKAAADVYETYLAELKARGVFDYDDMILKAIKALESNADLRFTLQEKYLYILLDEFQDTNGAQLRLVELLTDNPVNEGRPNVLAVGDDDQAIYAFQGANYSHMVQFKDMYQGVKAIPLTKNYRSHAAILHVARGIAEQIEERLHHHFPEIEKTLEAANKDLPAQATLERREAKSDVTELGWVAKRIKKLVDGGLSPSEIAVLAPAHKYLEPLVPFLRQAGVPMRYEKRENVLDDPVVTQLTRMSELTLALAGGHHQTANALWAEVLSFPFWNLPTSLIWQLSWQAHDENENWTELLLANEGLKPIVLFFIRLSLMQGSETLETMMDHLIGSEALDLQEPGFEHYRSPFYEYYFGDLTQLSSAKADFWQLLTSLTVLRSRLREYGKTDDGPLHLADFIAFIAAHRAADIKILNTSPYQDADDAVQLMTAFKSKGQEFEAVFILGVNDEVWGGKSRTRSTHLSLPQNLQFIRYAGATNDERLRLFYVAITRAKTQLYLCSYQATYAGKGMSHLKYLDESEDEAGTTHSPLLPADNQVVLPAENGDATPTTELAAYWQQRHENGLSQEELRALVKSRLERFQLSPTHVNAFVDIERQGPHYFFLNTVLRFPKAPTPMSEFGDAIHQTLEWVGHYYKEHHTVPTAKLALETCSRRLASKRLSEQATKLFLERAELCLDAYLAQRGDRFNETDECEYNFRNEGVFVGQAHLAGKIDKLVIDRKAKTITIVDYKTGKSHARWTKESKLHRYREQLYLYKTLVERSHTFAGYTVTDAYLEFVEPDEFGRIQELHVDFDTEEQRRIEKLTEAVWQHIQSLDMPSIEAFSPDLKGIEAFETWLIDTTTQ